MRASFVFPLAINMHRWAYASLGFLVLSCFMSGPGLGLRTIRWAPRCLVAHLLLFALLFLAQRAGLAQTLPPGLWFCAYLPFALTGLGTVLPPATWPKLLVPAGLGFLAACGGYQASLLWDQTFGEWTLYVCYWMLTWGYADVSMDPGQRRLSLPSFSAEIGRLCSGFEGMGLMVVILLTYFWLRRGQLQMSRAWLVLPLILLATWTLNAFRIAFLFAIGESISPELAVGAFHTQAGWISVMLVALVTIAWMEKSPWLHACPSRTYHYPALPFLLPFVALLLSRLFTSAFTVDFDILYPARVVLVSLILFKCWPQARLGPPKVHAWLAGLGVYAIWAALVPGTGATTVFQVLTPGWAACWLLARLIGSILLIPVVEELAFRGYLLRRLQSRHFEQVPPGQLTVASALLSSLAFGALHSAWLAGSLAGLAYAWVVHKTGSLKQAVLAHAISNGCIALQVLLLSHWSLWQ